jgi:hypothetical protein
MTSRLPELAPTGPNEFRDEKKKVKVRLFKVADNLSTPIPIGDNTNTPYKSRHVEVYINGTTDYGREFRILCISMKVDYCGDNINSTTEGILDCPVTTPGGDISINYDDIRDTIVDALNRFNIVAPF